jgi:disulfide bond formation protein DsbB
MEILMINMKSLQHSGLYLAWLISMLALLLTLYGSEVLQLPVCYLCWYQRIAMYSLAVILGIAAYRDDRAIHIYAVPLAGIGLFFAAYQYLQQLAPKFAFIDLCSIGPSCDEGMFTLLGFISFPMLSILAFILIIVLLKMAARKSNEEK